MFSAHYTRRVAVIIVTAVFAAACGKSVPQPDVVKPADDVDLKGAASYVAADLAKQLGPGRGRKVAIDPLLDRASGQQTGFSVAAQEELVSALTTTLKDLSIVPLNAEGVEQMGLVATGNVAIVTAPDHYGMSVALTDRSSGLVVAQAAARFRQAGLDKAPTRFYTDSPSLTRDRSVEGYLKTSETPAGSLADPLYVEQLPTAALIAAALSAYNDGMWEPALAGYTAAAGRPNGQTLRTFNGLYLTNMRLGRTMAAEDAFGKIAALGLATNNLAVKLLFRPGTTDFLADQAISGVYPMWIRQIARAARTAQVCLNITGHTSASGTESVNDRLSLARATMVRTLLDRDAPGLLAKSRVTGLGSRKNVVGTGADDATDAIDRRVEFEVEACQAR